MNDIIQATIPEGSVVVLGLSGGPDSICLLHLLSQAHHSGYLKVIAAHLDHEWRESSASDVAFCKQACEQLNIPFVSAKASDLTMTITQRGSQEDVGRQQRRFFLEKVVQEQGADCIALGHHLQDQQETFLIRLIRGSSLSGLTAMRVHDGLYVRPLLTTRKEDILATLDKNNIAYLTDPSNESQQFLRNRLRSNVLPALRACDERFDQNFLTSVARLQDTDDFLQQLTHHVLKQLVQEETDNNVWLSIPRLLELHRVILLRVVQELLIKAGVSFTPSESLYDEIIRFLQQPGSKEHALHKQWSIIKKKDLVSIQQTSPAS